MSNVIELTQDNFEQEVIKADILVIVDCAAEWCGPCKKLKPIVDELALDFSGKAKIGHLDVDNSSDIAAQYGILSVPTILFFKGGKKVADSIGLVPKESLVEKINELL
ncbi:thioredoxin [Candidatus Auribacterota bacterium]